MSITRNFLDLCLCEVVSRKLWVRTECIEIAVFCLKFIFLNNSRPNFVLNRPNKILNRLVLFRVLNRPNLISNRSNEIQNFIGLYTKFYRPI